VCAACCVAGVATTTGDGDVAVMMRVPSPDRGGGEGIAITSVGRGM
jgi:hypothetical protein